MLEHRGYRGRAEFDEEAGIFHGEVLGIRDVVTFEGTSVKGLVKAFRNSVEDYLDFCAARGDEPDWPFSGRLMVRLSQELHRDLWIQARKENKSLNQLISEKLADRVPREARAERSRAATGF